MNNHELAPGLSESERLLVMERLYELLRCQTTRYLAGDSTSLPVEAAQELFRSIVYTLGFARAQSGQSERALLTADLTALLDEGQRLLQCKQAEVHRLWEQACMTMPAIRNDYLRDTLQSMRGFFRHYDLYNFAHQIPCTIDYLLCVPVSEELQGVSYIEQWLRQLLIENWFLRQFPPQDVQRLLAKVVCDYWAYPNNLCLQPMVNAVGGALLRRSAPSLALSGDDIAALERRLLAGGDVEAEMDQATAAVVAELRAPKEVDRYIRLVLSDALPRIRAAAHGCGGIGGVFIAT